MESIKFKRALIINFLMYLTIFVYDFDFNVKTLG